MKFLISIPKKLWKFIIYCVASLHWWILQYYYESRALYEFWSWITFPIRIVVAITFSYIGWGVSLFLMLTGSEYFGDYALAMCSIGLVYGVLHMVDWVFVYIWGWGQQLNLYGDFE